MKTRTSTIFVLVLFAATASVAQKVNIDWDRGTDFSKLHTYAWQTSPDPRKAYGRNAWSTQSTPNCRPKVSNSSTQILTSGLSTLLTFIKTSRSSVPDTPWGRVGWGWWGGPTTTTYNTYTYKQGTLVVEIADANGHTLLWRGSATDSVSDNSDKNIKKLNNAISKMFKNFPPKPNAK